MAIGALDPPLSRAGSAQARAAAEKLASRPLAAVYSSDLRRATSTAAEIAAVHKRRVLVDARLRELDFGAWEGRDLAELWVLEPDAARAWEGDLARTPPSFGEDVAQLRERVAAFWLELGDQASGEVAVVAHRGSLSMLQAIVSGVPLSDSLALSWAHGSARWIAVVPTDAA